MRLAVAAIGRLKAGPERELVTRYALRIDKSARPLGIAGLDQVELTEGRAAETDLRKQSEAAELQKRLSTFQIVICFDERGKPIDSLAFADMIRGALDQSKNIACVIGGPDGLDSAFRDGAQHVISFGKLTMPHQLVRVLVMEQLYRATTILSGHPYHRV